MIQLQEASAKGPSKPLLLHTAEQGDLPSHQLGYQSLRAVLNVGLSRAGFQLRDWITGATHTYSVCRGGWPPPAPAAVPRIASTHEKSVFLGLSQWTEQDTVPSGREAERGDSEVNQRADKKQRKKVEKATANVALLCPFSPGVLEARHALSPCSTPGGQLSQGQPVPVLGPSMFRPQLCVKSSRVHLVPRSL
jgi:hypothetical protein